MAASTYARVGAFRKGRAGKGFAKVTVHKAHGPLNIRPAAVRIIQREYEHDRMVVTLDAPRAFLDSFKRGRPVSAEWGYTRGARDRFVGYIHHVEPVLGTRTKVNLVCVGASFVFRQRKPKVWTNRSAEWILRGLAARHRLSHKIPNDPKKLPPTVQRVNETSWQFMVRIAKDAGWTLYCHRTKVIAHKRETAAKGFRRGAPWFKWNPDERRTNVMSFNVVVTTEDGNGHAQAEDITASRVDLRASEVRSARLSDVRPRRDFSASRERLAARFERALEPGRVAHSVGELRDELLAEAAQSVWTVQARATLRGDARVHQGKLVYLLGLPDPEHNGYWYVHKVEHIITPRRYRLRVRLLRDGVGPTDERPDLGGIEYLEPLTPEGEDYFVPVPTSDVLPDPLESVAPEPPDSDELVWFEPDPLQPPAPLHPEDPPYEPPPVGGVPVYDPEPGTPPESPERPDPVVVPPPAIGCRTRERAPLPAEWRARYPGVAP